jgi:hypothetical protein
VSLNYWQIYDLIPTYPAGTANGQKDEPLNDAKTQWDNRDGFNGFDFYQRASSAGTGNLYNQWWNNCGYNGTG